MPKTPVAALQIGTHPLGTAATLDQIRAFEADILGLGLRLIVMPEALLGGYPKGEIFGTRLGYRLAEGRARFADYHRAAIDLDGPEVAALIEMSRRTGAVIVVGAIERAGASLYCTALFITPVDGLVAKHRKLMPTATERLIWAQSDGSTMPVVTTPFGRLGAAICWENHMPLFRTAMYAKGLDIWCAPTVDDRDVWQASMRHIAHEGRQFVISACQTLPSPRALGIEVPGWDTDKPLIRGGSLIVGPLGDVLAEPLIEATGMVCAEIDTDDLTGARYDFDVVGHYSRPDIFGLTVDERPRPGVSFYSGEGTDTGPKID